jgi:hypothetical protein
MAYEWAHKESENLEDVDPLFALCLAELQTLINARDLDSPNMLSRSNDKVITYCFNAFQIRCLVVFIYRGILRIALG